METLQRVIHSSKFEHRQTLKPIRRLSKIRPEVKEIHQKNTGISCDSS